MKTIGADVSHWEGLINWQVTAQWLPFVYYKCTDGVNGIDNTFQSNKEGCQAAGMPHAPYHWFQPEQDPIKQADHFVDTAGAGYTRYIADVEQKPKEPAGFVSNVLTFLLQIEKRTAIKPAIYTSPAFWNENLRPKPTWAKNYDLIIANYTLDAAPTLPIGWDTYVIWQYTKWSYFPGIGTEVDGDWFNGTLEQMRRWFGNYEPARSSCGRPVDQPETQSLQLKSLFSNLHIRQQPSISSKEIGHLAKDEQVQMVEIGGNDVWIRHNRGWTAVELNGYRYMEIVE
jgi:GH25 family lysozyme M1 (1,4-beta-N-acetylmuramidase)